MHVFREANGIAYWLARKTLECSRGLHVFDHPSRDMRERLDHDLMSMPVIRRVGSG